VAIAISLSAPQLGAADLRPKDALLEAAYTAVKADDVRTVQAMEPEALALPDSNAQRTGDQLVLHLRNGDTKIFAHKPECKLPEFESQCQKYWLIAHAGTRAIFVILKLYYESAEYLLIDDTTGEETVLRNFPVLSPSGQRAVVPLMNDELVGFAVQIWRREGHKFVQEWEACPFADGMYTTYEVLGWNSEDEIEMRSETNFDPPKPPQTTKFRLKREDSGWAIE